MFIAHRRLLISLSEMLLFVIHHTCFLAFGRLSKGKMVVKLFITWMEHDFLELYEILMGLLMNLY